MKTWKQIHRRKVAPYSLFGVFRVYGSPKILNWFVKTLFIPFFFPKWIWELFNQIALCNRFFLFCIFLSLIFCFVFWNWSQIPSDFYKNGQYCFARKLQNYFWRRRNFTWLSMGECNDRNAIFGWKPTSVTSVCSTLPPCSIALACIHAL